MAPEQLKYKKVNFVQKYRAILNLQRCRLTVGQCNRLIMFCKKAQKSDKSFFLVQNCFLTDLSENSNDLKISTSDCVVGI